MRPECRTIDQHVRLRNLDLELDFGNMLSMTGATLILPMLPSQILLNDLIYDASQTAIPTDEVDAETIATPTRWDIHGIERFMLLFGPISSVFDHLTFGILLLLVGASASAFHTGWFIESLVTQVLVIFAIRTRRRPFWRSRPSRPLVAAALAATLLAVGLPLSPLASVLGFTSLPTLYWLLLPVMVVGYLSVVETAKRWTIDR